MALSKKEIFEYINKNEIIIRNFSEKCLEPASYDFRLGTEGITSSTKKKINIKNNGYLAIEPGEFAIFLTLEYFKIPTNLVGNIGMKSKFARRGLILLAGLQIDPGFEGYLVLRVFNTSTQQIIIPFEEKVGMVQFIQLLSHVEMPYKGVYQQQEAIPSEDISYIVESHGMTMGNVINSLQGLITSITDLRDSQEKYEKRMQWIFGVAIGCLSILIGIVAIFAAIF